MFVRTSYNKPENIKLSLEIKENEKLLLPPEHHLVLDIEKKTRGASDAFSIAYQAWFRYTMNMQPVINSTVGFIIYSRLNYHGRPSATTNIHAQPSIIKNGKPVYAVRFQLDSNQK